jgi:serine/threonine protein kinase
MTQTADDFPQALPADSPLGDYRVKRVLGHGGFGITYLAFDLSLHKEVAIKEYLPAEVALRRGGGVVGARSRGTEEDFRWGLERFVDEARTLARFRHPNLVPVLRFFELNGTAYMVMEYERGESFAEHLRLRAQPYGEDELRRVLEPLLDGLQVVHDAGFLHRDIKPANIILKDANVPVLIDFGAARQALGGRSRTLTNIVTPRYAPIEQYSLDQRQGPWSDIYGLAAVAHTALVGEPPPDAVSRVPQDGFHRLAQRGVPGCSTGFLAAIDWGLEVFAADRPQTIGEWRDALAGRRAAPLPVAAQTRPMREGQEPTLRLDGATIVAPPVSPLVAHDKPLPLSERRNGQHRRRVQGLIAIGLLLAIAVAAAVRFWPDLERSELAPGPTASSTGQETARPPAANPAPVVPAPAPLPAPRPAPRPAAPAPAPVPAPSAAPAPATTPVAPPAVQPSLSGVVQTQQIVAEAELKADGAAASANNARTLASEARETAGHARLSAAQAASSTSIALATMDLADGSRYAGELDAGRRQGTGVMQYADGHRYAGEWRDDEADGRGVAEWPDGRRYEGEWHGGKRQGVGVMVWPDGRRYEGEWRDDRPAGLGIGKQGDTQQMAGEWRDTGLNGLGIGEWSDGRRYVGEWRDGHLSGRGTMTLPGGKRQSGLWQNDTLSKAD